MTPRDKNNFLVEIKPEVMDELNRLYVYSDDSFEPIAELHFSPYWGTTPPNHISEAEQS